MNANPLSSLMYSATDRTYTQSIDKNLIDNGYFIDFTDNDTDTGFKVTTYKNAKTGEYIIAFAGTETPQDWAQDANLGLDQWKTHKDRIFQYIKGIAGSASKIHFTGHSLGGALAQYSIY